MVTVYAIVSELNGVVYVGIATDPDIRLKQHNAGKSIFTKRYTPWRIFYKEQQPDWPSARKREKYLKSGIGKEFLKSLVP